MSEGSLRCLIYISSAAGLADEEVASIIERSRANNIVRGVTGFLLYNGRNFLQLIEGGDTDLLRLSALIARDPRHSGMVTLINQPVLHRACPGWTMGWITLADDSETRAATVTAQLPHRLAPEFRRLVEGFALLN